MNDHDAFIASIQEPVKIREGAEDLVRQIQLDTGVRTGIYFASKTGHAPKWRALRDAGVSICSSWIYEAEEGQTDSYAELSDRSMREIAGAAAVLLYCEPGELLKGALIEVGGALMIGKPVLCVGDCECLSRVFRKHRLWREFQSVPDALDEFPHCLDLSRNREQRPSFS